MLDLLILAAENAEDVLLRAQSSPIPQEQRSAVETVEEQTLQNVQKKVVKRRNPAVTKEAIQLASKGDGLDTLKQLTEDACPKYIELAIREAAKAGKVENVNYLLTKLRPNAWRCKGDVLNLAVEGRHLDLVKELVSPGIANSTLCKYAGISLEYAAREGLSEYVSVLLAGIGNKAKKSKINAVNTAMEHMQAGSVNALIDDCYIRNSAHLFDIKLFQTINGRSENESDPEQAECKAVVESLSIPRLMLMHYVLKQDALAVRNFLDAPGFNKYQVSLLAASLLAIKVGNREIIHDIFYCNALSPSEIVIMASQFILQNKPEYIKEITGAQFLSIRLSDIRKLVGMALQSDSRACLENLIDKYFSIIPDGVRFVILDEYVTSGNYQDIIKLSQCCSRSDAKHMYQVYTEHLALQSVELTDNVNIILESLADSAFKLANIPIRKFIDKEVWSNPESVQKIIDAKNDNELMALLSVEKWISNAQCKALRLLSYPIAIDILEKRRSDQVQHNVDDDRNVARARLHFNSTVQPYFEAAFSAFGDTDIERVESIECKIRELILDYVLRESNPSAETIAFISENKAQLIQGESAALAASLPYFIGPDVGYSAWRIYNPHAPIGLPGFLNLLTPQQGAAVAVFTTPAATSNLDEVNNHTTSNLFRQRVAYYYLAVVDDAIAPDTIPNRTVNFINKLAEIRNAEGLNFISCVPGHVTRIGEMGNFHPVAELPPSYSILLESFFKAHIVSNFKDALSQCTTPEEREHLFYAIISFSTQSAEDIVLRKSVFPDEYFWSRVNFIRSLGTADLLMIQFGVDYPEVKLNSDDIIYFNQYLADLTLGSIGGALGACYQNFGNMPATPLQIAVANPFKVKDSKEFLVFNVLINSALEHTPNITVANLKALSDYLEISTKQIVNRNGFRRQFLEEIIGQTPDINIEPILVELQSALNSLGYYVIRENSYSVQLRCLKSQLERMVMQPLFRQMLEARVVRLEEKSKICDALLLAHPACSEAEIERLVEAQIENNESNLENSDPRKVNGPGI
jgi:hypothetical protein